MKNGHYFVSIVVPVKARSLESLDGLKECYVNLTADRTVDFDFEVIIADDSGDAISKEMEDWFRNTEIHHFRPPRVLFTGLNNKLNSIETAMPIVKGEYVILLDDDCRPNSQWLKDIAVRLGNYDCLRCIVHFEKLSTIDLMNVCGIFVINVVCNDRQFWGNIAFHTSTLKSLGFPNKDVLFDELAFDRQFRNADKKIGYIREVALEMTSCNSWGSFLGQRIRYAYENIAYPIRFLFFLTVLPLMVTLLAITESLLWPAILFAFFTLAVTIAGAIGQIRYSLGRFPWYTFFFTPFWFWVYPFTSWIALFLYITKFGVKFGGNRIQRAL